MARAYSLGADHLAIESYQAAFAALAQGEGHIARGDHAQAREAFAVAEHFAREAILAAQAEKLRMEEEFRAREQVERERQTTEAPVRPTPKPQTLPSAPPSTVAPSPAPAVSAPPPTPVSVYDVQFGDTLWLIAARPEVYGDPLLWPLLYKSNRDQIKDPRQVYTGQTLDVPRNVSEREKEEVRAQARQSELFPVKQLLPTASADR
ncbi:LysM peptidoglycan-binding domain-containing protein [Geoalkalibacter ferrihydriticus]|uniref:LysM peptidoglycan-binding domain-containing protein n=1 Tax=Geoalkalibacter ferrihydriticus TaxID=392333 RepID=UPI000694014D|nr:LysM peptidoglycan-binding domain-containing protein [Geoalkalibacter ferrihydriticus]